MGAHQVHQSKRKPVSRSGSANFDQRSLGGSGWARVVADEIKIAGRFPAEEKNCGPSYDCLTVQGGRPYPLCSFFTLRLDVAGGLQYQRAVELLHDLVALASRRLELFAIQNFHRATQIFDKAG